jgi:predicted phage terminase large subunit-like protein
MVLAPTYPMLRDATLRAFLELAQRGGVLKSFNRSEMVAHLIDGKTILFRSADDADRLRGPNLGWFYPDEAALMDREVWLVMLGRLREAPGRAWVTTTPRGFNWLHDVFTTDDPNYAMFRSSSRDNTFLPAGFISSLEQAYTSEFARQEIEGEFTEPSGALFKRTWFEVVDRAPEGLDWARYWDLAASTKTSADYTVAAAVALADDGTLYVRDMVRGKWEWPDAKQIIMQTMKSEPDVQYAIEEAMHGLAAIQELHRERSIAHIPLRGVHVDKDKVSRALPWAARAEQGKVKLVRGPWVEAFLAEVCAFPFSPHDDQVDTVSGGLSLLAVPEVSFRWIGD